MFQPSLPTMVATLSSLPKRLKIWADISALTFPTVSQPTQNLTTSVSSRLTTPCVGEPVQFHDLYLWL